MQPPIKLYCYSQRNIQFIPQQQKAKGLSTIIQTQQSPFKYFIPFITIYLPLPRRPMKQETSARLQAAQQLLLQHRQLEEQQQSHNHTEIVVIYQKCSIASSLFGNKKPLEDCPRIRLIANNSVTVSEILFMARRSLKVPPDESLQFFSEGKLLTNIYAPVKELRTKHQGILQLVAVTLEVF